ncbi:membrane protein BRI3 [Prorops nasuta]|uniref:membrane protein BRI3 n=1 Tax=Prorops nasuta TaxID=863751 RepID=UPI0034CDE3AB
MENQPLRSDKPPPYSAVSPVNSWQPPPGYYPTAPSYPANNPSTYGSTQSTTIIMPEIIVVGACPACRVGVMEDDYTCLGLLCAIVFFPLGIIICLLLKTKRCSNCGAYFG